MRHLGFVESMVSIIMSCLRSVSYSILLNSQPVGNIRPSIGLRQGDPLSPYLFLLKKAGVESDIRGVSICYNGPWVSHMFFADDSLLFC